MDCKLYIYCSIVVYGTSNVLAIIVICNYLMRLFVFISVSDDDIDNLFDELDSDQNSLLDYREIDTILTIFPKFLLSRYKDEL